MTKKFLILLIAMTLILPVLRFDLLANDDFEKWKKQQAEEFSSFRTVQDEAFSSYLEEQWTAFSIYKGEVPDKTPKPEKIPESKEKPKQLSADKKVQVKPLPPKPLQDVKPIPASQFKLEKIDSPKTELKIDKKMDSKLPELEEKKLKSTATLHANAPDNASPAEFEVEKNEMAVRKEHNLEEQLAAKKSTSKKQVSSGAEVRITFWGMPLDFPKTSALNVTRPINEKSISKFWYNTSNIDYPALVSKLKIYREQMNLNDWAYCQLLKELGDEMGNNNQESILFVWFMLNKTGFSSRVGYKDNDVYLLLPSENTIYGVSYLQINDRRYHIFSFQKGEKTDIALYTYKKDFPEADNLIDLSFKTPPKVKQLLVKKDYKFTYERTEYVVPVTFDANLVKFYEDYPRTELDVYFNGGSSDNVLYSMADGLQPILKDRSQAEAVNIILRFVQTAFKYQTDQVQFGKEKAFFAEEIVFYPASDCEDRSILFAYLVQNILDLQVIALDYPGHISTAVKFDGDIKGDKIRFDDKTFIVCDPTYVNADVGMTMPRFKNVKPEIIALASI